MRWWLVLDRIGDRVVHRTPSWTDAYRVARRRSGGRVSLRRGPEYGVTVVGELGSCTVVTIMGQAHRSGPWRGPERTTQARYEANAATRAEVVVPHLVTTG